MQEFSIIGNIDKIIHDGDESIYLPYTLRILYALVPFISGFSISKQTHNPKSDDKTVERLFNLLAFTENKAQEFKYSPEDKLPSETLDLFIICDADVDQKSNQSMKLQLFNL